MGADASGAYKHEPGDMMYYSNASADTMNQTTDIFNALLEDPLGWNEDLSFNVSDGKYSLLQLCLNFLCGMNIIETENGV